MIGKPDKGNGVVVMDSADNMTNMKVILKDQSKFKAVHKVNNLENLVKFQRFLSRLKSKGAIRIPVDSPYRSSYTYNIRTTLTLQRKCINENNFKLHSQL